MKVYIAFCHDDYLKTDEFKLFDTEEKAIKECNVMSSLLCDKYSDKPYEEHEEEEEEQRPDDYYYFFRKGESDGSVRFNDKDGFEHYSYVIEAEVEE